MCRNPSVGIPSHERYAKRFQKKTKYIPQWCPWQASLSRKKSFQWWERWKKNSESLSSMWMQRWLPNKKRQCSWLSWGVRLPKPRRRRSWEKKNANWLSKEIRRFGIITSWWIVLNSFLISFCSHDVENNEGSVEYWFGGRRRKHWYRCKRRKKKKKILQQEIRLSKNQNWNDEGRTEWEGKRERYALNLLNVLYFFELFYTKLFICAEIDDPHWITFPKKNIS